MVLDKVASIIAKAANCSPDDIKPESELAALGLDSLDVITIIFDLEEAFDVEIPNEVIATMVTVNDILEKLSDNK